MVGEPPAQTSTFQPSVRANEQWFPTRGLDISTGNKYPTDLVLHRVTLPKKLWFPRHQKDAFTDNVCFRSRIIRNIWLFSVLLKLCSLRFKVQIKSCSHWQMTYLHLFSGSMSPPVSGCYIQCLNFVRLQPAGFVLCDPSHLSWPQGIWHTRSIKENLWI